MADTTFHDLLARDAAVFLSGPANGFGVLVTNQGASARGTVDVRYVAVEEGGFQVQRRRRVLRLKTGEGGTIDLGTTLTVDGVPYRVDMYEPVAPDGLFTDYVLAGGSA